MARVSQKAAVAALSPSAEASSRRRPPCCCREGDPEGAAALGRSRDAVSIYRSVVDDGVGCCSVAALHAKKLMEDLGVVGLRRKPMAALTGWPPCPAVAAADVQPSNMKSASRIGEEDRYDMCVNIVRDTNHFIIFFL